MEAAVWQKTVWRDKYVIVLLSLVVIFIQSILALSPAVNLEFAFVGAAEYFRTSQSVLIDQYFTYQANTLGMSYLAHWVSTLFPQIDLLFLMRFINILGFPLLIVGVYRVNRYIGINSFPVVVLLTVLNPLVWAFSARATADFMPAALGLFAISMALGKERALLKSVAAGVLLGLAAVLKYHVLCMLPLLAALLVYKEGYRLAFNKLFVITTISLLFLSFYLFKVHEVFGFWVAPEKYKMVHDLKLYNVVNNFVLYLGFLVLLALPTFFLSSALWRELAGKWKHLLVSLLVMAFLGGMFFHETGELNLGPLDAYVSERVRVVGLSLLFVFGWVLIFFKGEGRESFGRVRILVGLSVLFVVLSLSLTRPAQRYLLFVLPVFMMILPRDIIRNRVVVAFAVMLFITANAVIETNKWSAGLAAQKMLGELSERGIIQVTNPGAISPSVGDAFFEYPDSERIYLVVPGPVADAIVTVSAGPRFLGRTFSLVKYNH